MSLAVDFIDVQQSDSITSNQIIETPSLLFELSVLSRPVLRGSPLNIIDLGLKRSMVMISVTLLEDPHMILMCASNCFKFGVKKYQGETTPRSTSSAGPGEFLD